MKTITQIFLFTVLAISLRMAHCQDFNADMKQAGDYYRQGKFAEAAALVEQWLPTAREIFGENDTAVYVKIISWTGFCYYQAGVYDRAESLMIQAMNITKGQMGKNNTEYTTSIINLATVYKVRGRYDQAEQLMIEAINIDKLILGENNPTYAIDINNLAMLYKDIGYFDNAEPLMIQALNITREQLGENNPAFAIRLNNLAQLYREMGLYNKAEPLYIQAKTINKEIYGEDHPSYAQDISNLALLYQAMGRYSQAVMLLLQASKILREQLGENHPYYLGSINNLSQLYILLGSYELAEIYLVSIIRLMKENLGENDPGYNIYINNLALLYQNMTRYELAEPFFLQAMNFTKKSLGEHHPSYAKDLNNLGLLYHDMGRYEAAEPLMIQAMNITKEQLGEQHPSYAIRLNNLAQLYQAMGRYEAAGPLMIQAFGNLKKQFKDNTGFLSEKEAEAFFNTLIYNLEIYQTFNTDNIKMYPPAGEFSFDIELFRKGALLKSARDVRRRILESGDTALTGDYNRFLSLRRQIEKLLSLDPANRDDDPARLEQQANELEKQIALRSQDYRQAIAELDYSWKDVQKRLQPGEAVIEFASFRYYDKRWTDSTYYCALVLRPEYEYPRLVFLFEERALKELLDQTGSENRKQKVDLLYSLNRGVELVINEPDSLYQTNALYSLIWQPIDSLLKGVTTVWYCPSGLLHRISLPAVAVTNTQRLSDRYRLHCLSSSRELIPREQQPAAPATEGSIALFGGINYEWNDTQPQRLVEQSAGQYLAMRSGWLPGDSTRGSSFIKLVGTLAEVNAIQNICNNHNALGMVFTGDQATEAVFKSLSGRESPAIIHVATHGFFFEDPKKDFTARMMMNFGDQPVRAFEDPLLRSGLILAGGNRAWKGDTVPAGMEDGILQAKEVSNMDLRNTRLVVLSACETGLGDVKGSEGVFGLQRSFKMAGVDYLLISLWQVPDEATQQLMTMFYENLFTGRPVREAFSDAQERLRKLKPEYDDPYYWAAWVLVE